MKCKINVKPLSDNKLRLGRHQKTTEYRKYEKQILSLLPDEELLPKPTRIFFTFGFSTKRCDATNPLKALCDILGKKYTEWDDRYIYEANIKKVIVPKGEEFIDIQTEYI